MPELSGYKGRALSLLSSQKISVGDTVSVKTAAAEEYSGILMPRYELADDSHIVLKLKNGYNVGIEAGKIVKIARIESKAEQLKGEKIRSSVDQNLPRIALVSTGGTIASKIDYRTGGVKAALTAEELYSAVPELSRYARIDAEVLFSEHSENLTSKHWSEMAGRVHQKILDGYQGVVLTHGTDTLHYSAAALSFALRNPPVPVVMVGAQRSSDRPSSDAALNLVGAAIFAARADVSGVFVAMHAGSSDALIDIHLGTRVRKNHTSRRDAFQSIGTEPVAHVSGEKIEMVGRTGGGGGPSLPGRGAGRTTAGFEVRPSFEERVALLKYHPGMSPQIIEHLIDKGYRGLVLEGTGLGHVGGQCFDAVRRAVEHGVLVCMTSQCIWGRVRMTVYETGRDLLSAGVLPLSDMIGETALVKTMWALANSKDVEDAKNLLVRNIAMEFLDTSPLEDRFTTKA
ncbi:MAG: Glu-tRNA(Gln) amidotransferase subunit GatD [Nitrososphaerales archaeon]